MSDSLRSFLALVLASGLYGCHREEPLVMLGEPCASPDSYCLEPDVRLACIAGHWTGRSCSDDCPHGELAGCLVHAGEARSSCICGAPPPPEAQPFVCVDSETLAACEPDACVLHACDDVCAEDPFRPTSLGCVVDACLCSVIGAACEADDAPRCDGDEHVLRCVRDAWTRESCVESCEATYARCSDGDGEAACDCEPF